MITAENLLRHDLFQHPLIPAFLKAVRTCILYRNMIHAAVKRSFASETREAVKQFFLYCQTADDEELIEALCQQVWMNYPIIDTSFQSTDTADERTLLIDRTQPYHEWIATTIPWLMEAPITSGPIIYERIWQEYKRDFSGMEDETIWIYNFRFLLLLHLQNIRSDRSQILIFMKSFQDVHSFLIDTFLQIIYDQKAFDAVYLIHDQLFYEAFMPRPTYARQNVHMICMAARCYSYLPEKENAKSILRQLFQVLDEELPEPPFPKLPEENRQELINEIVSPKTNWTFSSVEQVENAYRLQLIDSEKYQKTITRILKNQVPELLPDYIPYPFRVLSVEKNFPDLEDPVCAPQITHLADALLENLMEYKQAFYKNRSTSGIRKYFSLRQELWKEELIVREDFTLLEPMIEEIRMVSQTLKLNAIADLPYAEQLLQNGISSFQNRFSLVKRMQIKLETLKEEESITITEGLMERTFRNADADRKRFLFDCTALFSTKVLDVFFKTGV